MMRGSTAIFIIALGFYLSSVMFYFGGLTEMSDKVVTMAVSLGIGSVVYRHMERLEDTQNTGRSS